MKLIWFSTHCITILLISFTDQAINLLRRCYLIEVIHCLGCSVLLLSSYIPGKLSACKLSTISYCLWYRLGEPLAGYIFSRVLITRHHSPLPVLQVGQAVGVLRVQPRLNSYQKLYSRRPKWRADLQWQCYPAWQWVMARQRRIVLYVPVTLTTHLLTLSIHSCYTNIDALFFSEWESVSFSDLL